MARLLPVRRTARVVRTLPSGPKGAWRVPIDGWQPTPLNRLLNAHWAVRNRMKAADAKTIVDYCWLAGVTKAMGKRRVLLTVLLGPRQRATDPDSMFKSLLDGLVQCQALKDDNRQWCHIMPVRYQRSAWRGAIIEIEDV